MTRFNLRSSLGTFQQSMVVAGLKCWYGHLKKDIIIMLVVGNTECKK